VAPPFRSAEFDIMFNHGISKEGNLVDLGVATGTIKKAGAFFTYGDTKLGQGRENAKDYLKQHPELASQLESTIRASTATPSISPGKSSETSPQEA
jgi:recombination protein RecA